LLWKRASGTAAVVAAIGTFFFSILFKFMLPDVPFLLRMGYVFACLVVLFFSISLMSKKTVAAQELDEHTIKTQLKWSKITIITAAVLFAVGIASMFSYELRCYGFEAIFFLALMLLSIGIYLRSNAKDKVEDPKSIGIDIAIFRTDKAFNLGAIGVVVIITILYIILW
jgi:SSS family solute:Na+ symporter